MKTILEMAREAGLRSAVLLHVYGKESALCDSELEELEQIKCFAALVRAEAQAEEREACAKVCDDLYKKWVDDLVNDTDDTADSGTPDCVDCAAAIRARGNK